MMKEYCLGIKEALTCKKLIYDEERTGLPLVEGGCTSSENEDTSTNLLDLPTWKHPPIYVHETNGMVSVLNVEESRYAHLTKSWGDGGKADEGGGCNSDSSEAPWSYFGIVSVL